mgnify:CR=1 FL=1
MGLRFEIDEAPPSVELLALDWASLGAWTRARAVERCEREVIESQLVGAGVGSWRS